MKLEKAIEILELNIKEVGKKMPPDTLQALKLGKHALLFYRKLKEHTTGELMGNFLGETEE